MRLSGKDFETVMKQEVAAVLSGAVRNTKKASAQKIKTNHAQQPGANYAFNYPGPTSRKGKAYSSEEVARLSARAAARRAGAKNGRLVYYLANSNQPKRYPDWLWQQVQDLRAKSLPKKLQARGLTASMWVRIAEKLGVAVNAPGYVRNARHAKKGTLAEMVFAKSSGAGSKYEIGFVNNLTEQNKRTRAGIAFRMALSRRANFFSQAVKLAAKGTIKTALARYPGLARVS